MSNRGEGANQTASFFSGREETPNIEVVQNQGKVEASLPIVAGVRRKLSGIKPGEKVAPEYRHVPKPGDAEAAARAELERIREAARSRATVVHTSPGPSVQRGSKKP